MYDPQRTLESLKALRHERGDTSPFATHTDFLRWADQASPLLEFTPELAEAFKSSVSAAITVRTWKPEKYVPAINNAFGSVNRAITLLEHQLPQATVQVESIQPHAPAPIEAPSKDTIKWLYEHVSLSLVGGGVSLLVTSFLLGLAFSETQLYALVKSTIASPSSSSAKPPANTIESQPKNVSLTASAPK